MRQERGLGMNDTLGDRKFYNFGKIKYLIKIKFLTHKYFSFKFSVCLFIKLVVVMGVSSLTIPIDYFFVSSAPLSSIAICFRLIHFIPFLAVLFIFGFNEKNMVLISQKYPRIGSKLILSY